MDVDQALSVVREHGVVLVSAKGPVPRMTELIAGQPIAGSWWAHPKGRQIFAVLQALAGSPELLVCRLVGGKVTYVHKRLWPALIRAAHNFPPAYLAQVVEEHTASGRHAAREIAFPDWADADSLAAARLLGEADALRASGAWTAPLLD